MSIIRTEVIRGLYDIDVTIKAEPEEESYESVYGDPPPPNTEFYFVSVDLRTEFEGQIFSAHVGCGFVDNTDGHIEQVVGELRAEALDQLATNIRQVANGKEVEQAKRRQEVARRM